MVTPVAPLAANTILQVAIVQELIKKSDLSGPKQNLIKSGETSFEYVVKKMLPSAAGTRFGVTYDSTHLPDPFIFTWTPDSTTMYGSQIRNLGIVAFLQNADTKEVFQSILVDNLNNPSVVTGLEPISPDQIYLYPNPADQKITIELPGVLTQDMPMHLTDQVGREVMETTFHAGNQSQVFSTSNLSPGLYIIQLGSKAGSVARKKLIVVHD